MFIDDSECPCKAAGVLISQYAFGYDAPTVLVSPTDHGAEYSYGYDPAGQLTESTDERGLRTVYTLDAAGRVLAERQVVGQIDTPANGETDDVVRTRTYTAPSADPQAAPAGLVATETDPLGHVTAYSYNARGLVTCVSYAVGTADEASVQYEYDAFWRVAAEIDALGRRTEYTYDDAGRVTSVTRPDPDGAGPLSAPVTSYEYDAQGHLVRETDPLGRATLYEYEGGLLVRTTRPDHDGDGQATVTTYTYTAAGQLATATDPLGRVTASTYDALGRRTAVTLPDPDGAGPLQAPVTHYAYDALGRVTVVTDPLGQVTSYAYEANGRRVRVTAPDPDGAGPLEAPVTVAEYDAAGNLVAETDAQGQTTAYSYDALGRLVAVTGPDPDGTGPLEAPVTTYAYDQAGRQTVATDATGRVTSYFYDARDRLVAVTLPDPDGAGPLPSPVLRYTYDAAGQRLTETDASGRTTAYSYDGLGRVTAVTGPDPDGSGPLQAPVTHYAYDAADRLTAVTDPLEHVTSYSYDTLDQRTAVTDASGTTAFAYDAAGNLLCLTDPTGNTTRWTYDGLDRVTSETDQPGVSRQFAYDALGRLVSLTDRNGLRRAYAYDDAGRLTTETWYAADGVTVADTLSYTYDAAGRVTSAGNAAGTYTYSYDAQGRLASVSGPFGTSLSYGYDSAGNRILVEDSFGGQTTSAYDDAGRLVSRLFSAEGQPTLRIDQEYDAWGHVTEQTRYSDAAGTAVVATSEYGYDFAGQVVTIAHQDGSGATIADYAAVFDAAGQLTSETDHGQTQTYAYDQFGQLTQDGAASYSYDANGNRDGNGHVVGDGSRLLSDGEWSYTYDAEGNLIGKANIATGETWSFAYDNANQLVLAEHRASAGGVVDKEVRFAYDAFGNRIEKDYDADGIGPLAAEVTRYALDGWKAAQSTAVGNEGWDVWGVLNGDGTLRERYLHGELVDQVFARIATDGQAGWYLTDRLGSVRDVVNQQGVVVDTVRYDAFGTVVAETAPAARGMYGWTARQYDAETGLQYNRARYYDPQAGRWISQDPAGFTAGDSNLYRYVGNNPTTSTDPSGLAAPPIGIGISRDPNYEKYRKYYESMIGKASSADITAGLMWPKLKDHSGVQYWIISPPYDGPNCLAYAAGRRAPFAADADSEEGKKLLGGDISVLTKYYKDNDYNLVKVAGKDDPIRPADLAKKEGYVKIVVFGHMKDGKITSVQHAAAQTAWGTWRSKLGEMGPVIEHRVEDLENAFDPAAYGLPIAVYEMKVPPKN